MTGRGVPTDAAKGAAGFQRACDLNAAECRNLGLALNDGDGVAKDPAKAHELWAKACEAGDASACNDIGIALVDGDNTPKDVERGTALLKKAGDHGDATACKNLDRAKPSSRCCRPRLLRHSFPLCKRDTL